jgi:predicted MFS family arabinose efflux permease
MPDTGKQARVRTQANGSAALCSFASGRAWGSVLLLTLVGMVNIVDRALPGILVEPIKHDLQLSDTAIGLINGFGFLLVYALLGVPIARLSDRGAFGLVITGCLSLWSLMTLLGSAAQSGLQLALTRMGVALGEAGSTPAAHAFIARNFLPGGRAAPLAVLSLTTPLSFMLAHLGGSLLGQAFGWRTTFVIMALTGLVLAPIVLLTLGPRQLVATVDTGSQRSLGSALSLVRKPSFLLILVGTAFLGMGGYTLSIFSAAFLMRVHGLTLAEMGVRYGLFAGPISILGVLLTGMLADRLSRRDARWTLWVVALLIAVFVPGLFAALFVPSAWAALMLLSTGNVIGTAYLAPVVAAVQRLAPPDMRATASALLLMCSALAGSSGPVIAGLISDYFHPQLGARSLAMALLLIPVTYTLAGLFYLAASATFRRDIIEEATTVSPAG